MGRPFETPEGGTAITYPGGEVYKAANLLASGELSDLRPEIVEVILKSKFEAFQQEMERQKNLEKTTESMPELEKRFGEEYRSLQTDLEDALEAARLKVQLEALEGQARKRGFASAEIMGDSVQERPRVIKEEMGAGDFDILVAMNRRREF